MAMVELDKMLRISVWVGCLLLLASACSKKNGVAEEKADDDPPTSQDARPEREKTAEKIENELTDPLDLSKEETVTEHDPEDGEDGLRLTFWIKNGAIAVAKAEILQAGTADEIKTDATGVVVFRVACQSSIKTQYLDTHTTCTEDEIDDGECDIDCFDKCPRQVAVTAGVATLFAVDNNFPPVTEELSIDANCLVLFGDYYADANADPPPLKSAKVPVELVDDTE